MRVALALLVALPILAQEVPPYPWEIPQEKQAILDQVRMTRVTIDVADASLDAALAFVTSELGLAVDVSAVPDAAGKKCTLKAQDIDADSALHLLLDPLGLAFAVAPGRLVVAPPDTLPAGSPAEEILAAIQMVRTRGHGEESEDVDTAALRRRLLDLPITMEFKDKTVAEVLAFVKDYSKFEYVVEPSAQGGGRLNDKMTVSLSAQNTWLGLEQLLNPRGLGFWLGGGVVHIDTKEEASKRNAQADAERKRIADLLSQETAIEVQALPIQAFATELEKACGLPVAMDRDTWAMAPVVTLHLEKTSLRDLLDKVREQTQSNWYLWKGRIYLIR